MSRAKVVVEKTADAIESAAKTTKDIAGAVEGGARAVSTSLKSGGNSKHRATRGRRPTGVITRKENAALPDIASRLFVDSLSERKDFFVKPISINPAGVDSGATAYKRFDSLVFSNYDTAVIRVVKYDTSSSFTTATMRDYINKMTHAYFMYYHVAHQMAFMLNSETQSQMLNLKSLFTYRSETKEALYDARLTLSGYYYPPRLKAIVEWLSKIYSLGRTPNAKLAQFIPANLIGLSVQDDASVALAIRTSVSSLTAIDRKVSAILGKVMPEWQSQLPEYADVSQNSILDFNFLNVWVNMGLTDGASGAEEPTAPYEYVLYNDNPNIVCMPFATIFDTVWQPGILAPVAGADHNRVSYMDPDGLGAYVAVTGANDDELERALRFMEEGGQGVASRANETIAEEITVNDLRPDTTTLMNNLFHVEEIAKAGPRIRK